MSTKCIKCVIVGDDRIGKSTLLSSLADIAAPGGYSPPRGDVFSVIDNVAVEVIVDKVKDAIELFDTIGEEGYDRLRPLSYPQTDVFLVCFSIANPASLTSVTDKWIHEISHHCKKAAWILVGLYADAKGGTLQIVDPTKEWKGKPEVVCEEGRKLAMMMTKWKKGERVAYVECDARARGELESILKLVTVG